MIKLIKNKKGFTLLELLIVLVVMGVIAGLMFPVLAAQVERGRAQEAVTALGTAKQMMVVYHQTTGGNSYANAGFHPAVPGFMGYDPNAAAAGQVPVFIYTVVSAGDTFTITATRQATVLAPLPANFNPVNNTITINEQGQVVRNGIYA